MRSISSACAARPPRNHDRRKLLLNGARPVSTTVLAATRVTSFLTASIVGAGAALRLRQSLARAQRTDAISGAREQKQDSKRRGKIVSLNAVALCRSIAVAPRAYWKGYLKLSLVSCPIALSPAASSSERISFRQINRKTGNRLRQQLVDEDTREPVEAEDKGRGYEIDKGVYVEVEDDELEAIRGKGMVALGRIVLAKRERVIALEPHGKGMLGTTLRYGYEVRKPEEFFSDIADVKLPAEMLKLAQHILDTKAGDFDPSAFEDHYESALIELLRKKQAGFKPPKTKEHVAAPRNVINLMDALRRSVQAERAAPAQAKKGRKRVEGQREMLLPIQGKEALPRAAGKKSAGRRKAG